MSEKEKISDNTIFVGSKNLMNYVNAVQWQLKTNKEIKLIARGKNIVKAIDTSQIINDRYMKDEAEITSVKIGSEEGENKEQKGKKFRVSNIEITIAKK